MEAQADMSNDRANLVEILQCYKTRLNWEESSDLGVTTFSAKLGVGQNEWVAVNEFGEIRGFAVHLLGETALFEGIRDVMEKKGPTPKETYLGVERLVEAIGNAVHSK